MANRKRNIQMKFYLMLSYGGLSFCYRNLLFSEEYQHKHRFARFENESCILIERYAIMDLEKRMMGRG